MKDAFIKRANFARLVIDALILILLVLLGCHLFNTRAEAFSSDGNPPISSNAPQTGSANIVGGADRQPWFVIGRGAYNGDRMIAKVYVPKNDAATLTISHGANRDGQLSQCGSVSYGDASAVYKIYYTNASETALGLLGSRSIGSASCDARQITLPVRVGGNQLPAATNIPGHGGYRVFIFEAQKDSCSGDCERGFRLSVNNGGKIGMVRPRGSQDKPFGVAMRDAGTTFSRNDPFWDFAVQFAPKCTSDERYGNREVDIYDVDAGLYGQENITARIKYDDDRNNTWNWKDWNPAVKRPPPGWNEGNHKDNLLRFTADHNRRYLLILRNFSWKNAIQFSLPYDQFDSLPGVRELPECQPEEPEPKPTILTCTPSPEYQKVEINQSATIRVNVTSNKAVKNYFYLQQDADTGESSTQNIVSKPPGESYYDFTVTNPDPRGSPTITYDYYIYASNIPNPYGYDEGDEVAYCGPVSVEWNIPPPVKPYIKVTGGDVFTGGWFTSEDNPEYCLDNYQTPDYSDLEYTRQMGGIYAFANNRKGAGSQYAAFATGLIDGSTDNSDDPLQYGFYTHGTSKSGLSFANQSNYLAGDNWGGLFEGDVQQSHCVPDYFNTKQSPSIKTVSSVNLGSAPNGQYLINGNTSIHGSVAKGRKIIVFVKGNVYINANINYPSPSSYGPGEVPKFALVVLGNIYIDPTVQTLDGLYIAQPDPDALDVDNSGVIWTCHNGNSAYNAVQVVQHCKHQLTFNGAVVAKQMNLWRINDGLNAGLADNPPGNTNTPAEVFNYTPEMVIGSPFFDIPANNNSGYTVESVVSLPPIF